jgi:hypothetical protein
MYNKQEMDKGLKEQEKLAQDHQTNKNGLLQ